jgi:VWFA-related protein
MPTRLLLALLGLSILGPLAVLSAGQSSQPAAASPPGSSSTLTLHADTRIVLADVTVTDRHGNPVHHLPASDFQVFDNDRLQRLASFEERDDTSSTLSSAPAGPAGVFSNNYQHLPPILNVLVLDTTNLELPDQMYLRLQLSKFVKTLPRAQPIAIFERHGDNAVLLQDFTTDPILLQAAVARALPRILLTGREYRSDTDTLRQIGAYLSQVPGRKNVLWFSGGSTAYLLDGLAALSAPAPSATSSSPGAAAATPPTPFATPSIGEGSGELREVYDELEAARVAIYPIDARALTFEGDAAMGPQQAEMNDIARATGGEAFFNMNGLARIASHIVSTDSSSYTLTYSPRNFHYDNKWHRIRITLKDSSLHLSYRRGYFADKPHTLMPKHPGRKTFLTGDSDEPTKVMPPDLRSSPLLFQAKVRRDAEPPDAEFVPLPHPVAAAKGTTAFAVDYSLSTSALKPVPIDGAPRATVIFAIIALDGNGERVAQSFDRVRFALSPDSPPKQLKVEQQIDLRKGSDFLALVVWDPGSGRLGSLEIPLHVHSPHQSR